MVTEQDLAGWGAALADLHARMGGRFRRSEQRERAKRYLAGLLERVERKNGWQLAEQLGEAGPQGVQRLLNGAEWDADAVRDDLCAQVVEHLGAPAGVLIIDETGFLKKGTKSIGVQRQDSGTAGRIEHCQIGVFLACASAHGHAFIDRALYLPEAWAHARARRQDAEVPEAITFATKPQLARQLLERALAAEVPATWVTGDEIYGDATELRRWLEATGQGQVLAVACAHPIWQDGVQMRADQVVATLPTAAWATMAAGAGSQGERWFDWAWLRLPVGADPAVAHWLLVRRSLTRPTDLAYYRACGPAETPIAALTRVAGMRWAIEVGFEDAKGVVGLDHDEVRKWTPWHRHITLVLLAHAALAVTRHTAAQTTSKGGRRSDAADRPGGPPFAPDLGRAARAARAPPRLVRPSPAPPRGRIPVSCRPPRPYRAPRR